MPDNLLLFIGLTTLVSLAPGPNVMFIMSQAALRGHRAGMMAGLGIQVANVVYFDYDSYTVKPEFQAVLEAHARFIKADGTRRANIEGHTDERGGSEYNIALGQKRAEAVRRALNALGVADGQIEAVSYGKEKPALAGTDEAVFAKNRRAEITYR
jgi:peptidoglycan-associated lipoprotein